VPAPEDDETGMNTELLQKVQQLGAASSWMLLTLGLLVGFVTTFVLFLSGMPEDHYTLVETEQVVEEYKSADAVEFEFYDRLNSMNSVVPARSGDKLPSFSNEDRRVKDPENEKQKPVELAADLIARADEGQAVEVAASSTSKRNLPEAHAEPLVRPQPVKQTTIVRKVDKRQGTAYYLQAGAFTDGHDATRMQDQLKNAGMEAFVKTAAIEGKQWYRVRIGPYYDSDELYNAQTRLSRSGISYLVIKVQS